MTDNSEVIRAIGRLEGKCDSILKAIDAHTDRMNRIDNDVERLDDRIRSVERKVIYIVAAATVLGFIIQIVVKLI